MPENHPPYVAALRALTLPDLSHAASRREWLRQVQAELKRVRGITVALAELEHLWQAAELAVIGLGDVFYDAPHCYACPHREEAEFGRCPGDGCRQWYGATGGERLGASVTAGIFRALLAARHAEKLGGHYGALVEARDYVAGDPEPAVSRFAVVGDREPADMVHALYREYYGYMTHCAEYARCYRDGYGEDADYLEVSWAPIAPQDVPPDLQLVSLAEVVHGWARQLPLLPEGEDVCGQAE